MRGVKKPGSVTVTSSCVASLRNDIATGPSDGFIHGR